MLKSFIQQFRRGTEQLQRRSEEVTQGARLRLELYQLSREQDALFARLGRAYYSGADQNTLNSLRDAIYQLEQDIVGRETLMTEFSDGAADPSTPLELQVRAQVPPTTLPSPEQRPPASKPPTISTHPRWSAAQSGNPNASAPSTQHAATTASRIWRAKERERQQGSE